MKKVVRNAVNKMDSYAQIAPGPQKSLPELIRLELEASIGKTKDLFGKATSWLKAKTTLNSKKENAAVPLVEEKAGTAPMRPTTDIPSSGSIVKGNHY